MVRVVEVRVQNLSKSLQHLAVLHYPSVAALLRCLLHVLLLPRRFGQPPGSCVMIRLCRCKQRTQRILHGGCWYESLSSVRGYSMIRRWPNYALIQFMMNAGLRDKELLLCGHVAKRLHMICSMLYESHPATRVSTCDPVVGGSWFVRARPSALGSKRGPLKSLRQAQHVTMTSNQENKKHNDKQQHEHKQKLTTISQPEPIYISSRVLWRGWLALPPKTPSLIRFLFLLFYFLLPLVLMFGLLPQHNII